MAVPESTVLDSEDVLTKTELTLLQADKEEKIINEPKQSLFNKFLS